MQRRAPRAEKIRYLNPGRSVGRGVPERVPLAPSARLRTTESTIDNPLTSRAGQAPLDRRRRTALLAVAAAAALAAVLIVVLSSGGGRWRATRQSAIAAGPTVVQMAAVYLHVPPSEVRRLLGEGQTLSEIATEKGASRKGLIEAVSRRQAEVIESRHLPAARQKAEIEAARAALARRVTIRRSPSLTVAAARYLGLSRAKLRAKLASGSTLAEIAEATPGRSRDGLIEAMTKTRRRAIETQEHEGRITPATARHKLERLKTRAERAAG